MPFIERTNRFKRDYKRVLKRGKNGKKLRSLISKLLNQEALPKKFRDHQLIGSYDGARECHIEPDWLLVYRILKGGIRLERTGSHSDLFD